MYTPDTQCVQASATDQQSRGGGHKWPLWHEPGVLYLQSGGCGAHGASLVVETSVEQEVGLRRPCDVWRMSYLPVFTETGTRPWVTSRRNAATQRGFIGFRRGYRRWGSEVTGSMSHRHDCRPPNIEQVRNWTVSLVFHSPSPPSVNPLDPRSSGMLLLTLWYSPSVI